MPNDQIIEWRETPRQFNYAEAERRLREDPPFLWNRSLQDEHARYLEEIRRSWASRREIGAYERALRERVFDFICYGSPEFHGSKGRYWPASVPVVAAVDWRPPPIKPGCEFRVPSEPIEQPIISFA